MTQFAAVVSLGCAKNLVDGETLVPQLIELGYTMTRELAEASLVVVNTCGFLESAVEESIDTILEASEHKTSGRCRCLVVTGCMVQRYGKKLLELLPEVDLFLGTSHYHRLAAALGAHSRGDANRLWIAPPRHLADSNTPRTRSGPLHTAYLKIAEGCSNRCSYCLIPRLRGPCRSRPVSDVVQEASRLVAEGAVELTLIAQDTTAFGSDLGDPHALVRLLEALDGLEGVQWIRLLYAYPDRITRSLVETMADSRHVVPYLDLPVQHCVPRILEAMHRGGSTADSETHIDLIRSIAPDMSLRTTLMVGFPGETEADFQALLRFVERVQFDHMGVFAFSPEPGTRAARLDHQVEPAVAEERLHRVQELQREISRNRLQRLVGRTVSVLVDGLHPETDYLLSGRMPSQAPEVDGTVLVTGGTGVPGLVMEALVTAAHDYDVEAELLSIEEPTAAMRPGSGASLG